ncbi:hypothetical protein LO763_11925 [Glycomyces sp. A-F 0318]|uniref:hypothetical protein n=1 Tax=Glycomyces amatae TaxID=2881355 RepID=UPI001E5993C7|nr:hypothetical protein [Glycomyces amatae]MCD0444331.1 hypothetical protein [Glycomyces amatae]
MEHYPYPPAATDRIDPFDTKRPSVQYIVFGGSRSTYAFTEPVDHLGFFMHEWIPMGYKVLEYAQKAAVCRGGAIVREWPLVEQDPPRAGKRRKTRPEPSAWERNACGYQVAVPSGGRRRVDEGYDRDAALEAAAAASRKEGVAVAWFVYHVQDWH